MKDMNQGNPVGSKYKACCVDRREYSRTLLRKEKGRNQTRGAQRNTGAPEEADLLC